MAVDNALLISASGQKALVQRMANLTNNLANASTVGFHADYVQTRHIDGSSNAAARSYAAIERSYTDFSSGPVYTTGRDLDIAIKDSGFIAIQTKEGQEAYTSAGNLQINADGVLVTNSGEFVLGDSGIIQLKNAEKISFSTDGSVSVQIKGQGPDQLVKVARLKLVNPPIAQLKKGEDGFFYTANGASPADQNVRIVAGALNGSNVDTVRELMELIDIARLFDFNANSVKKMDENSSKLNEVLAAN